MVGEHGLGEMSGLPLTVILRGKKYTLSPYTLVDYAAFEQWIKGRRVSALLQNSGVLAPEVQERIIFKIVSTPFSQFDFSQEMRTASGAQFMLWQVINKNDPNFTLEQSGQIEFQELSAVFESLTGIPPGKVDLKESEEKGGPLTGQDQWPS